MTSTNNSPPQTNLSHEVNCTPKNASIETNIIDNFNPEQLSQSIFAEDGIDFFSGGSKVIIMTMKNNFLKQIFLEMKIIILFQIMNPLSFLKLFNLIFLVIALFLLKFLLYVTIRATLSEILKFNLILQFLLYKIQK